MMNIQESMSMFWLAVITTGASVLAAFYVWRWRIDKRGERSPVSEKLLRPAGESLRCKIEELNETLGERLALAIVVPMVTMGLVLATSKEANVSTPRAVVAFASCAGLLLWLLRRAFHTAETLRDYRLGFHGERAVAEEINQLMREGCRVFHDVPMEPYGNIDHVVVSPVGVFAVETKTRRKRPAPKGKRDCDAFFVGDAVEFPTWRETEMIQQAKQQAERLRAFLTSAVGESVPVLPVLTLPGWFVKTTVKLAGFYAVNPGQIASIAANKGPAKLTPQMMQRIAHQLEQKCRDVEL